MRSAIRTEEVSDEPANNCMASQVQSIAVQRRLSEFRSTFAGDLMDLFSSELLCRHAGRTAGVTEKAVQAGRRHHPEQEQFVIGIRKPMPGVFGNEYRCALRKRVRYIVQYENAAAF